MASEFQIKNGLILGGLNSQTTTFGLSFDPSTGRVGYMSTSSFGSGSTVTGTSGTGTSGYITKWNTATSLNNSAIFQDINNNIGIGTVSPGTEKLYVAGQATITGNVTLSNQLTVNGITRLLGVTAAAGAATNVIMVNTATGQLYFTASSAIGPGSVDTSQFVLNSQTASFATTGSNTFIGNQIITGSVSQTGSLQVSGTVFLPSLTELNTTNRVLVLNNSGQLFYTSSFGFLGTTPQTQSIISFTDNNTFNTDRWNTETDTYSITGSWSNGQYLFVGASITTGSTILASTTTANSTTLAYTVPASPLSVYSSGSETFVLHVTASNPIDNSIFIVSQSRQLTLNKLEPNALFLQTTATVQLGEDFQEIEQGATGSIAFTAQTGSIANRWRIQSFSGSGYYSTIRVPFFSNSTGTQGTSTFFVTGSATGSNTIFLAATASYNSNGLNNPEVTVLRQSAIAYTKIRSVRGGASDSSSFTEPEILNIGRWDTSIGGNVGLIYKGIQDPNGQQLTINWSENKFLYIIYDSGFSDLSNVLIGAFPVNTFGTPVSNVISPTAIVGSYKVYRSTTQQAGYAGTTITYTLQT